VPRHRLAFARASVLKTHADVQRTRPFLPFPTVVGTIEYQEWRPRTWYLLRSPFVRGFGDWLSADALEIFFPFFETMVLRAFRPMLPYWV
jgi:hypothetical protein